MKFTFTKEWNGKIPGETAEVSNNLAQFLEFRGFGTSEKITEKSNKKEIIEAKEIPNEIPVSKSKPS